MILWGELEWWRRLMVCFSISTCFNKKTDDSIYFHLLSDNKLWAFKLSGLNFNHSCSNWRQSGWRTSVELVVNRICRKSFYCTEVEIARLFLCCPIIIQGDFFNWPPFVQYQNDKRPTRQPEVLLDEGFHGRAAVFGSSAFLISVPNRKKSPCTKS